MNTLNPGLPEPDFETPRPPTVSSISGWISPADRGFNAGNFEQTIDAHFTKFEVEVSQWSEKAYLDAFTCVDAESHKNVVYLYRSAKKVNRLVEASDILYIGQTKNSFQRRYAQYAARQASIKRNYHALNLYGPIRISACNLSSSDGRYLRRRISCCGGTTRTTSSTRLSTTRRPGIRRGRSGCDAVTRGRSGSRSP